MVAVAVEHSAAGEPGRTPVPGFAALSVLPNAGSKSLDGFLKDKIEPGSHVLTDGWNGYWHVQQSGSPIPPSIYPNRTSQRTSSFPGSISLSRT